MLVALGALLAMACPRPLIVSRPYPAPSDRELTETLTVRQQAVSSMNGRARATSWLGGDRVRATVLMLVDRPGRLRFEAEVSLQGTVAVLATNGRRFGFLDVPHNELRLGPACPANVASLIRIPLAPADVAAILLGDARLPGDAAGRAPPPPAAHAQGPASAPPPRETGAVVEWDSVRGLDVLAVRRNDGWLRFLFQRIRAPDPALTERRVVGVTATGPDGRARWRVAFEDFAEASTHPGNGTGPAASVAQPRTVRFAEGDSSFDEGVEIKFKEQTLNEPLAEDAFALAAPTGTRTVEVGCPR